MEEGKKSELVASVALVVSLLSLVFAIYCAHQTGALQKTWISTKTTMLPLILSFDQKYSMCKAGNSIISNHNGKTIERIYQTYRHGSYQEAWGMKRGFYFSVDDGKSWIKTKRDMAFSIP